MNILPVKEKSKILRALVGGCSIRSVERMTGHHRDTIMRLLVHAGKKAKLVMDSKLRGISVNYLEADELWTFVGKKDRYLTDREASQRRLGSQFIFIAMDSQTKLIPCFKVGKRDLRTALAFMKDLRQRIVGRPHLTTDKLRAYEDAVERAFGGAVDYAQLVKVYKGNGNAKREGYSPVDFVLTARKVVYGKPNRRYVSTSHIERQNLTLRMSSRRLTRLTNGFSKKLENLIAALYLHFAYYNFVRIHGSLRITPAMKAGITSHIWSFEEILNFSSPVGNIYL